MKTHQVAAVIEGTISRVAKLSSKALVMRGLVTYSVVMAMDLGLTRDEFMAMADEISSRVSGFSSRLKIGEIHADKRN